MNALRLLSLIGLVVGVVIVVGAVAVIMSSRDK